MKPIGKTILQILSIICFGFIISALLIIYDSPAKGYELSFYGSVSPIVWTFLVLSILVGIVVIVNQIFTANRKSRWWLIGSVLILSSFVVITIIPPLRGYVTYGTGDILGHAGIIKDMIASGHIQPDNFYPVIHILITFLSEILNINFVAVMNYFPVLYVFLFSLGIYLVSTAIFPNWRQTLIATASGCLLIAWGSISYGTRYGIFPTSLATLTVPLVLFLYLNKRSRPYVVLLFIMLFLFPFYHPFATVMLCVILLGIELSKILHNYLITRKRKQIDVAGIVLHRISILPAIFLFIVFFLWFSERRELSGLVTNFVYFLTGEQTSFQAGQMIDKLVKLNYFNLDGILLGIKMFGDHIIYAFLSIFAIVFVFRTIKKSNEEWIGKVSGIVTCFLVSVVLLFVMLIQNLGFTPFREFGFLSMFSTLLGGLALYNYFIKGKRIRSIWFEIIVVIILSVTGIIGVFHTYNSPYTMRPNDQVTKMQIDGFTYAFQFSDQRSFFPSFTTTSDYRYAEFILGSSAAHLRTDVTGKYWLEGYFISDHFNYRKQQLLGESLDQDEYIVLNTRDVLCYTELWPQIDEFNIDDFAKFDNDRSITKLYSNNEFWVYRVASMKD
jgi:hypothetical protein